MRVAGKRLRQRIIGLGLRAGLSSPLARGLMLAAALGAATLATTPLAPLAPTAHAAQAAQAAPEASRHAADTIWRAAMLDLRLRNDPRERDYRLVGRFLDLAQTYAPEDANLARERIEAWYQAGDIERVIAACRDALRSDPTDTVTQLRLFTSQISRLHTAEERLKVYERILGPDGANVDPSVRSRLALDAALLLRERGNTEGFVDKLSMATGLDSTNKEAAALAVTFYGSEVRNEAGLLELYSNLLFSDPFDPAIYQTIARLLTDVGAYSQARRFYDLSVILNYAGGTSPTIDTTIDQLVLRWHTEGPEIIVKELNTAILSQRETAKRTIEQLDKQGIPSTGVTPPTDLRLPIPMEQVRLLAAHAAGDLESARASAQDLAASVDLLVENIIAQANAGFMPPKDANQLAADTISELLLVTSLTGVQNQAMEAAMTSFLSQRDISSNTREQLAPWVDLRSNEYARALSKFEAIDGRSQAVDIGLAISHEGLGNTDLAARFLERAIVSNRLSPISSWARARRMSEGTKWEDDQTPITKACIQIAVAVPTWLDKMIKETRSFLILSAEATPTDPTMQGRPSVRITLRNTAPIPLAVGPDRSINSRMLLSPTLELGMITRPELHLPEVMNIDRRLRLRQGEALNITVWPEMGFSGWLAETYATRTVRSRWGLIQGFMLGTGSVYVPGAMCLATQTNLYTRNPFAPSATIDDLVSWIDAIGSKDELDARGIANRARAAAMLQTAEGGLPSEELSLLSDAFTRTYPTLPETTRVILLGGLPHGRQSPSFDPFDAVAQREQATAPAMLALLTRATDPEAPLFTLAESSSDSALREVAAILKARLRANEPTLSQVGPGLEAMAGPGIRAAGVKAPPAEEVRRP